MAKGFSLAIYPWVYTAKSTENKGWKETYTLKPHKTPEEEAAMSDSDRDDLLASRNSFSELPLVNYTTQYGMGCFEGMKTYPQADGSLKIFRPDENAARFARSMNGLGMPPFPEDIFINAAKELVKKNQDIGFYPKYNPEWEKNNFLFGESIYLRPFSYAEPGIGLGISHEPWVVFVSTPVGAYFRPGNAKARVTDSIRAFKGGTGWIKCDSNYVIPILEKKKAEADGFMETIFLDAEHHKYVEEGSSCNIFFLLKNGTLVTPDLEDTILPGITRKSLLILAKDRGIKTEERKISIEEAMSETLECFVTGTAAGLGYIESITKGNSTAVFNNGKMGDLSEALLKTLKGIQYGKVEDKYGWMHSVET
jgi:branched-chain amino acid aminotransferase